MLESLESMEQYRSIAALAEALGVARSSARRLLPLSCLAPGIVEAIVRGGTERPSAPTLAPGRDSPGNGASGRQLAAGRHRAQRRPRGAGAGDDVADQAQLLRSAVRGPWRGGRGQRF